MSSVAVWGFHQEIVKEIIHRAKYERAYAGLLEVAACMKELLPFVSNNQTIIVPVPTASSRVRERGYDQAVVIAKQISFDGSIPFSEALIRLNQAHQVGATRTDRKRHVRGCFRTRKKDSLIGKNVLLIDDVCTTGATLEEAARTLKAAGVKTISALVFSQPN